MALISVLTPSFNKPEHLPEAIQSVLNQTLDDFEYIIIDNSTDRNAKAAIKGIGNTLARHDKRIKFWFEDMESTRDSGIYPTAQLINRFYEHHAQGDYLFYLSDDDILKPNCFEELAAVLDSDDKYKVAYCNIDQQRERIFGWKDMGLMPCKVTDGVLTHVNTVDCYMDGGQALFKRECLKELEQPYYPTSYKENIANHCDGIFLQKLLDKFSFYPVKNKDPLVTHRRTKKSKWVSNED